MHSADQFHERVLEHAERLLDREQHQCDGDEEITGVMQEIQRATSRQEPQEHGHHTDAERHRTVDQRALALRGQHRAGIADAPVLAPVIQVQS